MKCDICDVELIDLYTIAMLRFLEANDPPWEPRVY